MEKKEYDLIIVGAGIVGLTTAYELAKNNPNKRLLIIEKEEKVSCHQTGRNSGVIHSGIYYKPNSLKAKNCLFGYKLLLDFAKKNDIPFELTGKLIVAINDEQLISLKKLYDFGTKNGLKNLKVLEREEIVSLEPYCTNAIKALYVPQSGIIDYDRVSNKLAELLLAKKVSFQFNKKVIDIKENYTNVKVLTNEKTFLGSKVVLCAGIYSDKFLSPNLRRNFRILPFKGEYFKLKEDYKYLVKGLIYPVPDLNFPFLGVHLTKTINGDIEAGPNAILSLSREGYNKLSFKLKDFIDIVTWKGSWVFFLKNWKIGFYEFSRSLSKRKFAKSLKQLVPEISTKKIIVGKSGIRAQIVTKNGELLDDFLIDKNKNIVNVVNAPSPAATSAFAIAKEIAKLV